ncbi:hypothetical protein L0936_15760, partial [Paracidovorax citrulli]
PRPRLFARRIERYAVPVIPTASIFADRSMNLEAGDWCWYAPPPWGDPAEEDSADRFDRLEPLEKIDLHKPMT